LTVCASFVDLFGALDELENAARRCGIASLRAVDGTMALRGADGVDGGAILIT
jgi:hypothetical protein